ncbi:MAG: hypothetical protein LBK53_06650 [Heliobacteriaceae bacterium]|jgi:hypothetical protein|nr:hypothetical protein [Heliobacteriaceae bacterium]
MKININLLIQIHTSLRATNGSEAIQKTYSENGGLMGMLEIIRNILAVLFAGYLGWFINKAFRIDEKIMQR